MSAYLEKLENKQRCNRWRLHVSTGSGKARQSVSRTFTGGFREAKTALSELEKEFADRPTEDCPTFAGFSHDWNYGRYSIGAISKSTYDNYNKLLGGMAMHIGKIKLSEVAARDIESALAALKVGNSPSGKVWGGTSLRTAYKVAKKMYDDAIARGLAQSNPLVSIKAPKSDTKPRKAMSLQESRAYMSTLSVKDAHEFAVLLMLHTGMRAGECLGVCWDDVTDAGIIVSREVTKTDAGARIIPLTNEARQLIEDRREYVGQNLNRASANLDGSEKLVCTEDGRPLTYNAMKHWWARNGLKGWTLHEMRHTFATNLAQANVHPSTMAALLGHASSEITMEIYTHVHREDLTRALEQLQDARTICSENAPKLKNFPSFKNLGQSF